MGSPLHAFPARGGYSKGKWVRFCEEQCSALTFERRVPFTVARIRSRRREALDMGHESSPMQTYGGSKQNARFFLSLCLFRFFVEVLAELFYVEIDHGGEDKGEKLREN